ncbi:MAG: translocation/assembly module TamB domain-containing protein [Tannerella sp.]|jgi:hypothetical protein|nr:translocation/assembly module TamB domain-containing protein [Tannerella sp.]
MLLYLIPLISLKVPSVQRKVTTFARSELSKRLGTPVKIEEIDVNWLDRIVLRNVSIEDKQGETAFEAGNITVGFKFWHAVLKQEWILTNIRLFGVTCKIRRETPQSDTNIQFILDSLSGENDGNSSIMLKINSILLRRSSITYDVLSEANTIKQFNPNHLSISNITGKLSVGCYSKDSINAQISKLSFNEISGLEVNKLSASVYGNRDSVSLKNFILALPHSKISIALAGLSLDNGNLLNDKSNISVELEPSTVAPANFAAFVPALHNFTDVFEASALVSGSIGSFSLEKLNLKYGQHASFNGNLHLKGIATQNEKPYISGQVINSFITTEGLRKISVNLNDIQFPQAVSNLGELKFEGEISGFIDNMAATGKMLSAIGEIQMDMLIGFNQTKDTTLFLKGNILSTDLQIHSLFDEGNSFGNAGFDAEIDISKPRNGMFGGVANVHIKDFDYKGYEYENIYLSGYFKDNFFRGHVNINDPNVKIEAEGSYNDNKELPEFDFTASISDFRPDKLNLYEKYEKPVISFDVNANFTGRNPDDFGGYIRLKNLSFDTAKEGFDIKSLSIDATNGEQRKITVASDIVNGELNGRYSFSTLVPDLYKVLCADLPALTEVFNIDDKAGKENFFDYNLTVENTEYISKTLKLPFTILERSRFSGHFDNLDNKLSTTAVIPRFVFGKTSMENGRIYLDNADDAVNLQVEFTQYNSRGLHHNISIVSSAKDDNINTLLHWRNDKTEKYEADIAISTLFAIDEYENGQKKLRTEITIPQSEITLKDSLWKIEPASVTIVDKKVDIDNFFVTKDEQYLHLDGSISDNPGDKLLLDLKNVELSYIFDVLNIPVLDFGGVATGVVNGRDLLGNMMIDGRLEVENFSFNDAVQGSLKLSSEWDSDRQGILLLGSIYKNDSTWSDVNGYIFPVGKEQGLSLYFNADEINIAFVGKYMKAFADSVSGLGYGDVHLYGSFSDVYVEGHPYIKDGHIKVNILNTAYTFSDTIRLDKELISVYNTKIYDRDGNIGTLNLKLSHEEFKNIEYELDIATDKALVYDIPERINPKIYGQIYATGTAKIKGTEDYISVDGNVMSGNGTSVGFNFVKNSTVEDYDFITFADNSKKKKMTDDDNDNGNAEKKSDMEYQLNFLVNVTPEAKIELIMDATSGDRIKSVGSGNIQIGYGSLNDIQLFGNYIISDGTYNFSLQQVIRKRFNIRNGSSVSFNGNLMAANLDINAIYNLQANIQDLDESLIMETGSPTVPVNCVLQLNGRLQNPDISFDLELPNSNSELERQVKSFIDTEDMMTRQIIYLLVLDRFYTPDYARNIYSYDEFSAMASSALSAQLSNILSGITDKVQIGTNIRSRQDGIKDTEVEMLLSSQLLNNRLLFNGNFGYKDNYIQTNAFVGEFDLEYKLTRTGEISLKAYNHTNDLYRYNMKALTRQGVGLMFRKDFSSLSDIFRRRKKKEEESNQP